jgi:hypothetical protein
MDVSNGLVGASFGKRFYNILSIEGKMPFVLSSCSQFHQPPSFETAGSHYNLEILVLMEITVASRTKRFTSL